MRVSGLSGPGSAALPAGPGDLAPSPRVTTDDRGVFLQWVPSNCGIPGNYAADALAREAAAMAQEKAPVDTTSVDRAATRLAKYLTARERPSHPGGARTATGWYRELMGERFPPPIAGTERTAAVYVHQMRTERWSGSAQLLHEIGRNRHRTACPRAAPAR